MGVFMGAVFVSDLSALGSSIGGQRQHVGGEVSFVPPYWW